MVEIYLAVLVAVVIAILQCFSYVPEWCWYIFGAVNAAWLLAGCQIDLAVQKKIFCRSIFKELPLTCLKLQRNLGRDGPQLPGLRVAGVLDEKQLLSQA